MDFRLIGSVNLRNGKRGVRSAQISKQSVYLGQHHPLVSRLGLFHLFIYFSLMESARLLSIADVWCASCSNNVIKRKMVHQQRCRSFFLSLLLQCVFWCWSRQRNSNWWQRPQKAINNTIVLPPPVNSWLSSSHCALHKPTACVRLKWIVFPKNKPPSNVPASDDEQICLIHSCPFTASDQIL